MQSLTHELIARAAMPVATPIPGLAGVEPPDEAHLRAELTVFLHGYPEGRGLWLFAYGALMAKPETASPDIVAGAKVPGYVRAYSLYDVMDRGTREAPGLTLALEKGPEGVVSSCTGVLMHVPAEGLRDRLWAAWKQEMAPGFYEPGWVDALMLPSGAPVRAATFLPKRSHPLDAGRLPVGTVSDRLARARGPNGTAAAYLLDASTALRARGLRDAGLEMLEAEVARRLGAPPAERDTDAPAGRPRVRVSPAR